MKSWTSDIAYSVGLITTDGNLSKDRRHISLISKDRQLLKTFKKCLDIQNRICLNPPGSYSKNKCYKVTFGDVVFYKWLLEIGLKPSKTFNLGLLKVPDKYFPDFLRGHIDGDGSIINYIDKHNKYKDKIYTYKRLYVTLRSGSLPHIKWIQENIKRILHINGSLSGWRDIKGNRKTAWTLRFCKKDSLIILRYLYYSCSQDFPCLHRKKKIADIFIKNNCN